MKNPKFVIEKVEIKGLFGKHDLDWELHPDVNILAGINGSGKTTILEGIFNSELNGEPHKTRNIDEITAITNYSEEDRESKLLATVTFDDDGPTVKKQFYFFEYISIFENLIESANEITNLKNEWLKSELDFKLYSLQKSFINIQLNILKQPKLYQNLVPLFYDLINEIFRYSKKQVNEVANELQFIDNFGRRLYVYQLSTGEKQILIILLTVFLQNQQPSILLIDEPELSLHIDWQRNLIKHIRTLNPNCQLIITSHSPGIAMNGWLDKVFEVSDLIKETQTVISA